MKTAIERVIERVEKAVCECGMSECENNEEREIILKVLREEAEIENQSLCEQCINYEEDYPTTCGLRFLFEYETHYCKHDLELPDRFEPKEVGGND